MASDYLGVDEGRSARKGDRLGTLDRKIAKLQQARVGRAVEALKSGVDPELLRSAVELIESELAELVEERDRSRPPRLRDKPMRHVR